jgi:hypothetical protein
VGDSDGHNVSQGLAIGLLALMVLGRLNSHRSSGYGSSNVGWSTGQSTAPKQPVLKQCHACESGLTRCFTCNGTGQVRDQVTGVTLTCSACGGRGGFTCSVCQGRGYRYEQP